MWQMIFVQSEPYCIEFESIWIYEKSFLAPHILVGMDAL